MIEQITVNPINEALFSADFIKGFRCGAKRQFQADVEEIVKAKFERPTGEWIFKPKDAIELMFAKPKCSECGFESADGGNFCGNCGARMYKGGDSE